MEQAVEISRSCGSRTGGLWLSPNAPGHCGVLECGRSLPLSVVPSQQQSGRGLSHSRTLIELSVVIATIGGQLRRQLRQTMRSTCDGSLVAHFGLGDATQVEVLCVEWPSGIVQEFHDLTVGRLFDNGNNRHASTARIARALP